jgi:hypothetical protein
MLASAADVIWRRADLGVSQTLEDGLNAFSTANLVSPVAPKHDSLAGRAAALRTAVDGRIVPLKRG